MAVTLLGQLMRPCKTCGLDPTCYIEAGPATTITYCKDANGHTFGSSYDAGPAPAPDLLGAAFQALSTWNSANL